MATRSQREKARRNRAEIKRTADPVTKVARRLVRLAMAEPAKHSVLHRLHAAGRITYEQWQAGTQFREDELRSRDSRTMDLDPDKVRGGGNIATERLERQAMALRATRDAMTMLSARGKLTADLTCVVCIGDAEPARIARVTGATEQALMVKLRDGLDTLKKHYGDRR